MLYGWVGVREDICPLHVQVKVLGGKGLLLWHTEGKMDSPSLSLPLDLRC